MPSFGQRSINNLDSCHPDLQQIFLEVVISFDCSVLWGHRNEEDQNRFYHQGFSNAPWPESLHNHMPSKAIDVVPYPIDWQDRERFCYFAGYVKGIAERLEIPLRWGGDWDSDWHVRDEHFVDMAHWELL